MELALNILGFIVCGWLTWGIFRGAALDRRGYVACIAIALVCVALVFPAISMTDDISIGILAPHDDSLPRLKFWQIALQVALLSVLLMSALVMALSEIQRHSRSDVTPLPLCGAYMRASHLRAPPLNFV